LPLKFSCLVQGFLLGLGSFELLFFFAFGLLYFELRGLYCDDFVGVIVGEMYLILDVILCEFSCLPLQDVLVILWGSGLDNLSIEPIISFDRILNQDIVIDSLIVIIIKSHDTARKGVLFLPGLPGLHVILIVIIVRHHHRLLDEMSGADHGVGVELATRLHVVDPTVLLFCTRQRLQVRVLVTVFY